ncbi:hypothetical protein [Pseudomonas serbica]|uniref:hypothetical protein n=1 Tax=Pseudomonas serbica TaxID=2965074 RepID=UPI00237BC8C4|nr:hypothetical protein [Pseudomonas serbica]
MSNAMDRKAPLYTIKKRGKYLKGSSYATGYGYSFCWTNDPEKARHYQPDNPKRSDAGALESHRQLTRGEVIRFN